MTASLSILLMKTSRTSRLRWAPWEVCVSVTSSCQDSQTTSSCPERDCQSCISTYRQVLYQNCIKLKKVPVFSAAVRDSSCPQKPSSPVTDSTFRAGPGVSTGPNSTSPASPNQMSIGGYHIPQIHIDEASPSEPRTSGSVLENRDVAAESEQSSLDGQAEGRRSSASSTVASTSSGSNEWLSRSASPDEVSMHSLNKAGKQHHGSGDSDSVARFQQYLRTRGLNLDLTSVQSSNV